MARAWLYTALGEVALFSALAVVLTTWMLIPMAFFVTHALTRSYQIGHQPKGKHGIKA